MGQHSAESTRALNLVWPFNPISLGGTPKVRLSQCGLMGMAALLLLSLGRDTMALSRSESLKLDVCIGTFQRHLYIPAIYTGRVLCTTV